MFRIQILQAATKISKVLNSTCSQAHAMDVNSNKYGAHVMHVNSKKNKVMRTLICLKIIKNNKKKLIKLKR